MDRRAFLGAIAAGTTASALKVTAAERALGETGVPSKGASPCHWGRYPAVVIRIHTSSRLKRPRVPSDKPGSVPTGPRVQVPIPSKGTTGLWGKRGHLQPMMLRAGKS